MPLSIELAKVYDGTHSVPQTMATEILVRL